MRRNRQDERAAARDKFIAAGCTVAQAAWLSGIDEPHMTPEQLAERAKQFAADVPGVPAEPETAEGEPSDA